MTSLVFKFPQPAELDITLVIVSFNTREILLRCLGSIIKHTQEVSYEVIIVDNASEDGTVEAVIELFPEVEVIAMKIIVVFPLPIIRGLLHQKVGE